MIKRVALSPVETDEEREAESWFHNLSRERRSQLILDIARLTLPTTDLREISAGPLGELFRRYGDLFPVIDTPEDDVEQVEAASDDNVAATFEEPAESGEVAAVSAHWASSHDRNREREIEAALWSTED